MPMGDSTMGYVSGGPNPPMPYRKSLIIPNGTKTVDAMHPMKKTKKKKRVKK